MTTISLVRLLLAESCELPNLLLHQNGFTTLPGRPGASHVANSLPRQIADTATLFTFLPIVASLEAKWDSIVSVALSLGLGQEAGSR